MTSGNVKDVHVSQDDVPWKMFRGGIHFKLLRTCSVTGTWVVLFRHEAGTEYLPHKHIGAGEYFVLKGRVELRGGVENGGITATAGDYGYEPNGIVHEKTYFPEPTEYLFINHGP
ncbi:cupin domain-containing protein [Gammaproteobacteria bacterium]|nr:cupin domain-containing protein [Gammaproteobacteria bacterium]